MAFEITLEGSFLALAWVLVLARLLIGNAEPGSGWGLLAIPLLIGVGFLYGRWMKRLGEADVVFVTRFLRETLQADDRLAAS